MQFFTWTFFLQTAAVLWSVVALIVFNIYLFVRRRRTLHTVAIHVASLMTVLGLIVFVLSLTLVDLPLYAFYNDILPYVFNAMGVSWVVVLFLLVFWRPENVMQQAYQVDLMNVLDLMDDIFLIFSYDHVLVSHNQTDVLTHALGTIPRTYEAWVNLLNQDQTGVCQLPNGRFYWMVNAPIRYRRSKMGWVMVLVDVTDQRLATLQIENQNIAIAAYNLQLMEDATVSEALAEEQIRKELIDRIQKDLINRLDEEISRLDNEPLTMSELPNRLRAIYKTVRQAVYEFGGRRS